MFLQTNGDVK